MIDPTTLPRVEVGDSIVEGQEFVVSGRRFDTWPEEVILSYDDTVAQGTAMPTNAIFRLKSRTDTQLVFEATAAATFSTAHEYKYFASPFAPVREILEYRER